MAPSNDGFGLLKNHYKEMVQASETGAGGEPQVATPDTAPDAREIEKEYFKILHKQNVKYDSHDKKYKMKYFASDSPAHLKWIALQDIKTEHSLDDDHLKYPLARFCYWILAAAFASLFSAAILNPVLAFFPGAVSCASHPGFFALGCAQIVAPSLAILLLGVPLLIRFAFLCKDIENNFVSVDAQWQNSIDQFFGPDVYTKMMGVRLCMLKFRQFIKWRRFANFFLQLFLISAAFLFACAFVTAIYLQVFQLTGLAAMLVFLAGLYAVIQWFLQQRYKHTEWRDPTVQLCVMIAELHQRLIERQTMVEETVRTTPSDSVELYSTK